MKRTAKAIAPLSKSPGAATLHRGEKPRDLLKSGDIRGFKPVVARFPKL